MERPDSHTLIFRETGRWQPDRGRGSRFHNVFRWSRLSPERIRLEHGRLGWEQPVFLFDLVPQSTQHWVSLAPHLCGRDTYTAIITLCPENEPKNEPEDNPDDWHMAWQILGPQKQAHLHYTYRH